MAKQRNILNVYKGPDSIRDYFDPDSTPHLPLVELPKRLNPYHEDGVRIYTKLMTMHPTNNVKSMPALNLLANSIKPEMTETVVEYTSGSTAISMALIGRGVHNLQDMRAFLSNKVSPQKMRVMQLFGIDITLFGGPPQPEPTDEQGGIRAAQRMAEESPSVTNPNQYENDHPYREHGKDNEFKKASLPGTMTGLGTFFSNKKPSVFRLGVCTAAGDRVPGARLYSLLEDIKFQWKEVVDHVEEVGSKDAYGLSVDLTQEGIICGPSTLNLKGLYGLIEKRKNTGTLNQLAGPDGQIHCVFICCDTPYLYIDDYFDKLGVEYFNPIRNEELIGTDKYNYDSAWNLEPPIALYKFFDADTATIRHVFCEQPLPNRSVSEDLLHPKPNTTIIDLRQPSDFARFSLPGSFNRPLAYSHGPGLFSSPKSLRDLWVQLEGTFSSPDPDLRALIDGKRILILCYNGDASRVATSVLRAKGIEADSMADGLLALREMMKETCQHSGTRLPN